MIWKKIRLVDIVIFVGSAALFYMVFVGGPNYHDCRSFVPNCAWVKAKQ